MASALYKNGLASLGVDTSFNSTYGSGEVTAGILALAIGGAADAPGITADNAAAGTGRQPGEGVMGAAAGVVRTRTRRRWCRGSCAGASRVVSMWSAAVFDPAFPALSTIARDSPFPPAPCSAQAVIGWKPKDFFQVAEACSLSVSRRFAGVRRPRPWRRSLGDGGHPRTATRPLTVRFRP
jgi:hypothetical protein